MQYSLAALTTIIGFSWFAPRGAAQSVAPAPFDDQADRYVNFEVAPVRSVVHDVTSDRLLVLNQPGNRLAILHPATLELEHEIPIALGAASLALRPESREAWIVDRVYATVQVVDLDQRALVRSIRVGAEPHGIAFSPDGLRAWVACTGADSVVAIDTTQYAAVQTIPIPADAPRGIAYHRGRVWVASQLSGNATAACGTATAPNAAKDVGATGRPGLQALPDLDLFPIRPGTQGGADVLETAQAVAGVGTILFDVVPRPDTDELWIPGTDALNADHRGEASFVRGRVVQNRISIVRDASNAVPHIVDLDELAPAGVGCAQPTSLVFDPLRPRAYVCAYGSDLVAVLDIAGDGTISWAGHVEIPAKQSYPRGSGPRSAAVDRQGTTLWVFDRNDQAVARIPLLSLPTATPFAVTAATPHGIGFDPSTTEIQLGRHLFTDARNSSSKTSSCASCHVDGNTDAVVWELSHFLEPEGTSLLETVTGLDVKGPLVTQGTRRQAESGPYHWRGEKRTLAEFNSSFLTLLDRLDAAGAPDDIGPDFQYLRHYLDRIAIPANPRQQRDRGLTAEERRGLDLFRTRPLAGGLHCAACHALPLGSNGEVASASATGVVTALDVPGLRGVGDREQPEQFVGGSFGHRPARNAGLTHAGVHARLEDSFARTPTGPDDTHAFALPADEAAAIAAFLRAFDTGLAPATTWMATAHAGNWQAVEVDELAFLLREARKGHCELVAFRTKPANLDVARFTASAMYDVERDAFALAGGPIGEIATGRLLQEAATGRPVTFLGVPRGMGLSIGLDRDVDGLRDVDEVVRGTDPEDVDTDGDKFPDGYEVLWGTNPRVPQASVADTTSPALVGPARVVFATSNTVKIEFETNEFTRIYLGLDGGPPIQRLPLGKPGDWKHWVVLENLEPDREYVVDLVMRDPAHNYRTDSTTRVRTAPRALPIPTRVTDIRSSIVLAGPTYVAEVDVRRGDVPVGAGYRVSGALHRWEFGALLPTVVAELADAPTNAAGRAQVRVSLGAIPPTPGTLYFVLKDVVPPPGGAPYARAGSVEVFDSIVY